MDAWLSEYIAKFKAVLDELVPEKLIPIIALLTKLRDSGGTVFAAGNGGSAATASHFATDLAKLGSTDAKNLFRALALCDNVPMLTALGNDDGYEAVFAEQLRRFARPGDVLMAFSTSGNSPNVVKAVEFARSAGMTTAALTGEAGGRLAELADHVVKVPDDHVGRVEDAHLILAHMICYAFAEGAA